MNRWFFWIKMRTGEGHVGTWWGNVASGTLVCSQTVILCGCNFAKGYGIKPLRVSCFCLNTVDIWGFFTHESGFSVHTAPLGTSNYQVIHEHKCQVHLRLRSVRNSPVQTKYLEKGGKESDYWSELKKNIKCAENHLKE